MWPSPAIPSGPAGRFAPMSRLAESANWSQFVPKGVEVGRTYDDGLRVFQLVKGRDLSITEVKLPYEIAVAVL